MFTNRSPGSIHSGIKEATRRCGICCCLTAGTVFGVWSLAAYFLPSYQIGSFSLSVFCAGAAFSAFLTAGLFVFLIRPADHSSKPSADTSCHEADLHVVNQNLSAIIEASPLAIVSLDAQGCVSIWNRAAEAILGWKHEEVVGRPYPAVPEDKQDEHREMLQSVISDKGFAEWDVTRVRKDGESVDLTISTAPLLDQCGCVNGIMGIIADVTGNKKAEHDMRLLKRAIDSSINGIFIVDASAGHPISYVNPAFEKITGYSSDEVLGRNAGFLHGEDHDQHELVKLEEAVTAGEEGIFILRNYRKDGTLFWNELVVSPVKSAAGDISHFVAILNDITERKRIEAELVFLANHDPLTGLPNRNLFQDRLGQALAHSERYGEQIAVIFLDLDHFKMVNDTLGHKYGDLLLKGVAARIRGCLRKGDTVARPGGDEFALILPHITQSQEVITVAEKLVAAISSPFVISGREIYTSASLGITMYPGDGTTLESLLKNADTAVFHAKEQGRKNYQFYSSDMNVRALERMALEGSLRHALRKDEFILHYQPRVDLSTGNIIGMEALLRWQHPEQGLIFPSRFISLAEDTGLIIPIGEWVLRTACRQTQAWLDKGLSPVRIAVNLSALQFRQPDLVGKIADILKETGLDSSLLELEITESIAMQNAGQAIRTFQELKEMGIQLAIDDFGTGYSSLNYLKRFPIDMLKIDQSFVRDVSVDPDDAAIVKTIITMAHSLGLRVIAEGVETVDQLRFLLAHDCEEMQGYLFSKPVSAEAFAELLRTKKTLFVGGNLRSLSI